MSVRVGVLSHDWHLLREAYPGVTDDVLAARAIEAAERSLVLDPEDRVPDDIDAAERVERLRALLARKAGAVAVLRHEIVAGRDRFEQAEWAERDSYERHLELEKDVVPPLKLEAKALRAELRRVEREARDRGIDAEAIEPSIDWPSTIAVDAYEGPRYETNEERRRTAVEFFRRVAGS
jgi:hypothetical protein